MSAYGFDQAFPGSELPTPLANSINQILGHRGAQKMVFGQIPEALREPPQWVCWELETRGGKATKVPYSARTGRKASSDDASTWATFGEACHAARRSSLSGIGFVFCESDPYAGVDLDHVIDPETGEMESWAQDIVDRLGSYTEISQSGAGLHVIVKAKLPPGRRREGRFEIYDTGRYFCMTGDHLQSTPHTIEARQAEIEGLHHQLFGTPDVVTRPVSAQPTSLDDTVLLEKMFAARGGAQARALWGGDPEGYGSLSEADLALCGHLAFWTGGDPSRIDALFRQSGLMRDKWRREDYRQRTIAKALQGAKFYDPAYRNPLMWRQAPGSQYHRVRTILAKEVSSWRA